jgi:hypothetical protein
MYIGYFTKESLDMMDIILGTVDRKVLDGEALEPEAYVYWDCRVPWLRDLASEWSKDLRRHSLGR